MTQLLVSVRDRDEALAALAGGAAIIDIKEPLRGALGAADVAVWRDVLDAVAGQVSVSAALGELLEPDCLTLAQQSDGLDYVKAGLANCACDDHWVQRLATLRAAVSPGTQLVAVAYADHQAARAPSPSAVLAVANQLKLTTVLIDTFEKSTGDLLTHLSLRALGALIEEARRGNLQVALAGSLRENTIPLVQELGPAWIAVRGAACFATNRTDRVSQQRVRQLAKMLRPSVGFAAKQFPVIS